MNTSAIRRFFAWAATLVALVTGLAAHAQSWPSKPITLFVGFPAGGTTDVVGRVIGNELSRRVGQPVIVENRPGAGGTIAVSALQAAPDDGHTLMMLVIPTINFYHFSARKIDYRKDIEPVAGIYDQFNVLVVNPAVPEMADVRTLQQLMAKAKATPNGLNYASTGVGSLGHLTMERIAAATGAKLQHISYKGGAPAMADLLGGQIGMSYADSQSALPHVRAGKLRAIAVSSATRQPELPNTQTMAEQGLDGMVAVPWGGIAAPPSTPKALVERISGEIKAILESPDVREKLRQAGVSPAYKPAGEFRDYVINESAVWGKVISERNIKPE